MVTAILSALAGMSVLGFWPVAPAQADEPPEIDAIIPVVPNADSQCVAADIAGADGDCRTDNAQVYWYMAAAGDYYELPGDYALEETDRVPVRWIMANIYAPTDVSVVYHSSPVFSGPGETDVVFYEGSKNFPRSDIIGVTWCNDPVSGTAHLCDQTMIMIRGMGNITRISASHEVGHALGLVHPTKASPAAADGCSADFAVMRESTDCITSAHLGSMLTDNINWVY